MTAAMRLCAAARRLLAGLALGLLLALPQPARAESDLLKTARNTFEYGNYTESVKLAENLLASHQLSEERDLVDAYRIAGLSNFYLNRPEAARRHFVALLSVDPDYAMDPFLVPPAAVAFFDGVKRDNEALLKPIRERRKAMAEQEKLAQQARQRLLEENLLHQMEPDRPVLVQRVEVHTWATNFVPFGAGQFEQDRPAMGAVFAGTQLAGLATFFGCYAKIESLRDENGRFAHADVGTARNLDAAKWVGLGFFATSVGLGIADSLRTFQPTTTTIEPLKQPPSRAAPAQPAPSQPSPSQPQPTPAPASPTSARTPTSPTVALAPWATPHGAGLGLGLTF